VVLGEPAGQRLGRRRDFRPQPPFRQLGERGWVALPGISTSSMVRPDTRLMSLATDEGWSCTAGHGWGSPARRHRGGSPLARSRGPAPPHSDGYVCPLCRCRSEASDHAAERPIVPATSRATDAQGGAISTTTVLLPSYLDVTRLAITSFLARYREPTLTAYTQGL